MSLASRYAQVLKDVDVTKVLRYMKARGHLSLLPKVVRILEREPASGDTVVVAHEKDVTKYKKKFPESRVEVDEKIVGGYISRSGTSVVDASYRHALVSLYQKTIT